VSDIHLGKFSQHPDVPEHAKVTKQHMPPLKEEDVARLDVAMDDAHAMSIAKRITQLPEKWPGVRCPQPLTSRYPIFECTGSDKRRHQV
jgi:hypothetical protein